MKKILVLILLMVLFLTGYLMFAKKDDKSEQGAENQIIEISRKNELELEGFINDYFYRRRIKDSFLFGDFEAYGSVLNESIVIYIYLKDNLSQDRKNNIRGMIGEGLQEALFNFSDFEWAEEYKFEIIIK